MTALAGVFGEAMLRACVLAAMVALGLSLLRVRHARVQKRAWTAVLVLALAMPALVFWHVPSMAVAAPSWSTAHLAWVRVRAIVFAPAAAQPAHDEGRLNLLPNSPSADPVAAGLRAGSGQAGSAEETNSIPSRRQGIEPAPSRPQPPLRFFGHSRPALALGFYLLVAAVLLARIAAGLLLGVRIWQGAEPFVTDLTSLPVRRTSRIAAPATLGSGILLPEEAADWDGETLRGVLAHEAAHVRERDFYLQLAASVHAALFWASPLAWWLRPQLARLSEILCDRAALKSDMDGPSYAQLLLRFSRAQRPPAGMAAMARSAGLRERVERLLADPGLASRFRHRRAHAIAAWAVVSGSAYGAAATLHFVQPEKTLAQSAGDSRPITMAAPAKVPGLMHATMPEAAPAGSALPIQPRSKQPLNPAAAPAAVDGSTPPSSALSGLVLPPAAKPAVSLVPSAGTEGSSRTYAIFGPDGDSSMTLRGWYRDGELLQKQHARHPGAAIWFEQDGKAWVIDDPALIREALAAYAPVEALGRQQGELGQKQGEFGAQQGQLGGLEGEFGGKLGLLAGKQSAVAPQRLTAPLPPDFNKTLQQLTNAQVQLALNQPSLSAADRARLEAQRKDAEAKMQAAIAQLSAQAAAQETAVKELNEQRGPIEQAMRAIEEQMRELGRQQSALGAQQAELGRRQSELSRQQHAASAAADSQVQALIDRALRDGKAHPVE